MKNTLIILLATGFAIFGCSSAVYSQDQLTVEMKREKNGKKETFKKEYDSYDEMMRDPEYQKWVGEDSENTFRFHGYKNMKDGPGRPKAFMFEYDSEGDMRRGHHFPGGMAAFDFDWEEIKIDSMMEETFRSLHRKGRPDHRIFIGEEPTMVQISEPTKDDFGGKAVISASQRLITKNMTIKSNFPGEVSLSFEFDKPTEARLIVTDTQEKQVFYASYSNKIGVVEENIPMHHLRPGKYLLELKAGGNSWTQILTKE